jgi:hypothetical protein
MIRSYLSASVLLHIITVIELLAILLTISIMNSHPAKYVVIPMACLMILFTQLDARSRFQEFKKVRDQLIQYGPNKRIFKSVASSRCQRDAALAAAIQTGFAEHCENYYTTIGYRWYHLLPDFVKSHPEYILSVNFWRTTFFNPTYHVRYTLWACEKITSQNWRLDWVDVWPIRGSKTTGIVNAFADFGREASTRHGRKPRCENVKLFFRKP